MRAGWLLLLIIYVAGCAGVGGYDIRPPRNAVEQAETDTQLVRVERVRVALQAANRDICGHLGRLCTITGAVGPGDRQMGAASDGKIIQINLQFLRFLRTDSELALILAHEWTHNMVHWRTGRAGLGRRDEIEADCVGTALAMKAGYDGAGAAQAFARMAASGHFSRQMATVGTSEYPSLAERRNLTARAAAAFRAAPITRDRIRAVCGISP